MNTEIFQVRGYTVPEGQLTNRVDPFNERKYAKEHGQPILERKGYRHLNTTMQAPRPGAQLKWSQWQVALSMVGAYVRGDQGVMTPYRKPKQIPASGDRRTMLWARRAC